MPEHIPDTLPERIALSLAATLMQVDPEQVMAWVGKKRLNIIPDTASKPEFERGEVLRFLGELDVERRGDPKPFPIVAIGSSAGGLEAASDFLEALETDLHMAYVFISHLSPDHESLLPELLQKRTTMPVSTVVNGTHIKPDHVYVIPPDANMGVVDGMLTLRTPRSQGIKGFHPINDFFIALAEAYQMNAIGVVLSGTASDGTLGLKAIKAGGGWTFAQDDSARFTSMPDHAREAGAVDFTIPPAAIAAELALLRRHPIADVAAAKLEGAPTPAFSELLTHLRIHKAVDFAQYKRATIMRRVLRRLVLHKLGDVESYVTMLKEDPRETDLLFEDLLINVTSFFRDGRFHEALRLRILPALAGEGNDRPLRIWSAGCSSGEEAVSIAITVMEYFRGLDRMPPVQIFATDLDPKMIGRARLGLYGAAAMESVSPAIMARYFTKLERGYQVNKPIRELCVFAQHDLLRDPPFSRMDLISCQNVLIYFNNAAQRKVLHNFHYALLNEGLVALGRSESANAAGELFRPSGKEEKIYAKRGSTATIHFSTLGVRGGTAGAVEQVKQEPTGGPRTKASELDQEAERLLLHRHAPASLVVNEDLEIVRFRGATAPYLAPQSGKASLNLLKLVREDLVFELRGLLQKVKQDHVPISHSGTEIEVDGVFRTVHMEVAPMRTEQGENHYLVVFLEDGVQASKLKSARAAGPEAAQDAKEQRIALLEREVRDVRDQMRVLLEEAEGKSEQLQTAHEEMLSSNEELQSMNEELETSKEELQSTNEELTTINDELLLRQSELKEARDYADGIITTIGTPLVVLNSTLRVRRGNAAFYAAFRTTPEETEGVLLHEIGDHKWDVAAIRGRLMDVLHHGAELQGYEVRHVHPGEAERIFTLSARRIAHMGLQQRLLVTLEDVTQLRRNTLALERLAAIVTNSRDAILSLDLDGRVTSWNHGAERIFGWDPAAMIGRLLDRILPSDRNGEVEGLIERVKNGEYINFFETERKHKDGHMVHVSLTVSPIRSENGSIIGVSKIERDLSDMKAMTASLAETEQRFHLLAENMDQLAWIAKPDGTRTWLNHRWEEFTGWDQQEILARSKELHHPEHYDRVRQSLRERMAKGEVWECTFPLRGKDGRYRWFLSRAVPQKDADGTVKNWFGTSTDITEMMRAEEDLQQADRRKDEFLATLAHELRNPMAPLRSGLDILQMVEGDADFVQTRTVMKRQVDHLARLVEDLLDLGRINTGRLKLRMESMDPRKAIQDATEAVAPLMKTRSQHMEVQKDDHAFLIHGDAVRITQVFSNLLHNASKFTPEGGHIRVSYALSADRVEFQVEDDGIGIEPAQREHVFDMFAQVDPEERAKAGGGLGIGLHLVKRLVEMHGGSISVEDNGEGKGSRFVVSLPLSSGEASKKKKHVLASGKIKDARVLLVDDNKDSALMLSMVLRVKGAQVEVAHSGEQGLQLGETFVPTTIFMDIGMPGMDGYEACRRMRATTWGAKARIVALSGWGQEEDKRRSKEAGFDDHLVKPVERSTLFAALEGK